MHPRNVYLAKRPDTSRSVMLVINVYFVNAYLASMVALLCRCSESCVNKYILSALIDV